MGQDPSAPGAAVTAARCPWCSAELSGAASASCPSCGATLVEPDAGSGANALDAEAISRATRIATPIKRSRLLSWITGDYDSEEEVPAPPGSLAPPPPDVRREMVRIELQAEYANLQAEAESIVSEAEAEARGARRRAEAAQAAQAPQAVDDPGSPKPD